MLHRWDLLPSFSSLVRVTDRLQGRAHLDSLKILSGLVVVILCLSFSRGQAWGEIGTENKRTIVAAGFG
ncbi:MAG: hypothetical protein CV081_07695, partial [Nitrospira sp. LK265]|nr:hypothetical protein [Nitrospira sp. LK265]